MIPIVEDYLNLIKENMVILEIGCGSWSMIRDHCEKVGARYEGIDVKLEYFGEKTVATRLENLANLSFADETFDLVIGNQSMEHWPEFGCTLGWGLFQCFRVCKTGGLVLMNVPIHFHGVRPFILGDISTIRRLFTPFSQKISFFPWGSPPEPLSPLFPHKGYWALSKKPAYILDIHAVKDRYLPQGYNNRGACQGLLGKLLNWPPSYIIYRVLRKAGIWSDNKMFIVTI